MLIGLSTGAPLLFELNNFDSNFDIFTCTSNNFRSVWFPCIYFFRFIMLIPACIQAYLTRNVPSAFNESVQLATTIYNLTALSVLLPIIEDSIQQSTNNGIAAHGIAVLIIATTTIFILMLPKFAAIHRSTRYDSAGNTISGGRTAAVDNNLYGSGGPSHCAPEFAPVSQM
jgi:hypothetical protein